MFTNFEIVERKVREHYEKYPTIKDFFANLEKDFIGGGNKELDEVNWSKISLYMEDNKICCCYKDDNNCKYCFILA